MRRTRIRSLLSALVICTVLAVYGCAGRGAPDQPPAPVPVSDSRAGPSEPDQHPSAVTEPGDPEPVDLDQVDPADLELEVLAASLVRYINEGEGSPAEKVARLYERWEITPGQDAIPLAEADLDGDGTAEVVTALNAAGPGIEQWGDLFVIHGQPGVYRLDRAGGAGMPHGSLADLRNVRLHAVTDLDGDGRGEIVWSTTTVGAHTAHSVVTVSTWSPGGLRHLPESATMANMRLRVEGADLILQGGVIGSVGAGAAQRPRTDIYRVVEGRLVLADQRYAPSAFGYHRLLDGIIAEKVGRRDDAQRAYRDAMEPERVALPPEALDPAGMVEPELRERFDDAVRALARVRLTALLLELGEPEAAQQVIAGAEGTYAELVRTLEPAGDRAAACEAAAAYAREHPDFLEALNAVYGYATPQWREAGQLCGPLPPRG